MNEKPTNSSSKDLSWRTVIIVLSVVWAILIIISLCVGAWPMAIGFLVAPLFFPIFYYIFNFLGLILIGIPCIFISRLLGFILPKRFKDFAANKRLHPIVLTFPFLGLFGILLIIFRDFVAVTSVLLGLGLVFGLPALANWFLNQRKRKKPPIDPPSEFDNR